MTDQFSGIDRRCFMEYGAKSALGILACGTIMQGNACSAEGIPFQARFYEKLTKGLVRCHVCPRECVIENGGRGFCKTRENQKGVLYSVVYGKVAAANIDPVEKKPFYHYLPGSTAYSIATAGCNFTCKFCQNWELSQVRTEDLKTVSMTPSDVASEAKKSGSSSIAYTYNEPTVFSEYVHDCAAEGVKKGVRSIVVSNGYIMQEPLQKLCEVISAYKVDLKSFSDDFYKNVTSGERGPVLETIKRLKKAGIWTELVHLTIPTLNDRETDFKAMGDWLMSETGPDVPVHFTRFHPTYRLTNLPVTPVATLEKARNILMDKGMKFVYIGNVPGHPGNSTWCPKCGKEIIRRAGFSADTIGLKNGICIYCKTSIPGIWY